MRSLKFKDKCDCRKFEYSIGFYCWKFEQWVSVNICNNFVLWNVKKGR